MFAAAHGHAPIMRLFAEAGADIHAVPRHGVSVETLAHRSIRSLLRHLLQGGHARHDVAEL
jgi:hypothetical protein